MQKNFDILSEKLFQKVSFADVEASQVEAFIREYPYASAGHLLLVRSKAIKEEDVHTAAEKASFYTHNPLWINYLIQQKNKETISFVKDEPDPLPEIPTEKSPSIDELIEEPVSPVLASPEQTPAQEIATATPATPKPMQEEELLFEPYHTIDYFASQGIKLAGADYERDKFGKQLKSFTEWLKVMKKVNIANAVKETDQVIVDPEIEKSATASIKTEEILTEAMAEVWVKQGNKPKATEIYRKLSLQNPSKSDYFADKIAKLNA